MIEISDKLREKIKVDLEIDTSVAWKLNGDSVGLLEFNSEEKDLFEECVNWLKTIRANFPSSKNYLKIDKIGRFKGVRPWNYENINIYFINFQVEEYEEESWKDWFVELEKDYDIIGIEK